MIFVIFALIFTLTTKVAAAVIVISSLSNWQNNWDEELIYYTDQNMMLTGIYSEHNNDKEDRRWRFWYGSAAGVTCTPNSWTPWQNDWDANLDFNCGSRQALSGIWSYHTNSREDRRWRFRCCDVSETVDVLSSRETDWLNNWDDVLNFRCGASEVLRGLESYHDNRKEDRLWKATCVALADNDVEFLYEEVVERSLTSWSGYVNDFDQILDFTTEMNQFIVGFQSFHNNDREDRRWKIGTATLGLDCSPTNWSPFVNDWDIPLHYLCPPNHALAGVYSEHSNKYEDRIWKFKCCHISATGMYVLKSPVRMSESNTWDNSLFAECPQNSVLVGVESYHNNRKEDRVHYIYCSELARSGIFFDEVFDLLVSSNCLVGTRENDGTQNKLHTVDNTLSGTSMIASNSMCIERNSENSLTLSQSTCSTDTLSHTTSYTQGVSNEVSVEIGVEATVKALTVDKKYSITVGYKHLRESSETSSTSEGTEEQECNTENSMLSESVTLSDCSECSATVPAGQCIILKKTATYEKISATCDEVREVTAIREDGSQAEYAELLELFQKIGIESTPSMNGPHALRYTTTTYLDISLGGTSSCSAEHC